MGVSDGKVGIGVARDANPSEEHIPELDGIRGIAALSVMSYHFLYWSLGAGWNGVAGLLIKASYPGWLGVDLFFILSGFLITGILLRTKDTPGYFRTFYVKRVFRILPLYFATLLIIWFADGATKFVLVSLVFLSNYSDIFGIEMAYGPIWSLSVEEHFYLCWPWLVRYTNRSRLFIVSLLLCGIEPLARWIGWSFQANTYFHTLYRLDGLAYGALLAILASAPTWNNKKFRQVGCGLLACGLLLGAGLTLSHHLSRADRIGSAFTYTFAQMIFAGGIAIILGARGTRITAPLRWKVSVYFGEISYCLYISHVFLMGQIDKWMPVHFPRFSRENHTLEMVLVRGAILLCSTVLISTLSGKYFERPIMSLRKRFL